MAIKSLSAASVALLGVLAMPPVLAENAYLGLSAGESQVDDVCDDLSVAGAGDCDDRDTAGKVFGGWNLNDHIGIEAAYVDLGEAEADIAGTTVGVEARGVSLSAVATIPIGAVDLFGKIGAFGWETDDTGVPAGLPVDAENDGTDATYGIGARVALNDSVALRTEVERYEIDDYDVDVASVGIEFLF